MSQVKYYHVSDTGLAEGVSLGRITVVLGADYDAAQSDLAALREELADLNRKFDMVCADADSLQQRLADAERRNAELIELLRRSLGVISDMGWDELEADIGAALTKPEGAKP